MAIKRNVSFVKYQESDTSESESVVLLHTIASPSESVTPLHPITSQPIAFTISVQQAVNPSSLMLKTSLLDFLNDLMIMNCQRHDWTLLLAKSLTAVPYL